MLNIIIASLSALATIAAAIIYYKTLEELKRQRQNTYRPHLFIDSIPFNVAGVERENIIMPLHWTDKKEEHNKVLKISNDINTYRFNLKCYNIGFGTAKKVEVKFNLDLDSFIKQLNKISESIDPKLVIGIEERNGMISFSHKNDKLPFTQKVISKKHSMNDYISYVLPANISNTSIPIQMPRVYLELLNISIHYLAVLPDKSEWIGDDVWSTFFPIIKATLKYEDIYNVSETKSIEIVTEMFTFGSSGYFGHFKVTEL